MDIEYSGNSVSIVLEEPVREVAAADETQVADLGQPVLDGRDGRDLALANFRPRTMLKVPQHQLTQAIRQLPVYGALVMPTDLHRCTAYMVLYITITPMKPDATQNVKKSEFANNQCSGGVS